MLALALRFIVPWGLMCSAVFLAAGIAARASGPEKAGPAITGGPCEYRSYSGTATVVSIESGAVKEAGQPFAGARVELVFHGGPEPVPPEFEGREFVLRLANSWYPGPRFLSKYSIIQGRTFSCMLKIGIKGACTPYLFEIPEINLGDYFESKS